MSAPSPLSHSSQRRRSPVGDTRCPGPHAALGTMRLFLEGEAASGRGSGGSASFPPSFPSAPNKRLGRPGPMAKRSRVAHGWQGLTGLIQLAGRPQPRRNSAPAGLSLGSCSLCDDPMHMDTVPPLWHAPHFWHLRLCSPPPQERRRPWSPWTSWETVWLLGSPVSVEEGAGRACGKGAPAVRGV